MKKKEKELSDYESQQLAEVMQMVEGDEEMFSNINGGYAECKLVDHDEEIVRFDLEFGKQDMGGGDAQDFTDNITIDRGILANKELSIRQKVARTH